MLHKRLKELRQAKGMTQIELAKKTGLSITQISQMENGKKKLIQPSFEKILEALGTNIEEYFSIYTVKEEKIIKCVLQILKSDNKVLKHFYLSYVSAMNLLSKHKEGSHNNIMNTLKDMTKSINDRLDKIKKNSK